MTYHDFLGGYFGTSGPSYGTTMGQQAYTGQPMTQSAYWARQAGWSALQNNQLAQYQQRQAALSNALTGQGNEQLNLYTLQKRSRNTNENAIENKSHLVTFADKLSERIHAGDEKLSLKNSPLFGEPAFGRWCRYTFDSPFARLWKRLELAALRASR